MDIPHLFVRDDCSSRTKETMRNTPMLLRTHEEGRPSGVIHISVEVMNAPLICVENYLVTFIDAASDHVNGFYMESKGKSTCDAEESCLLGRSHRGDAQ